MEKIISKHSLNSLSSYFNSLSKLGYKSYMEVNKLLVLLFIEEILSGNYINIIEEDDYKSISNAITCILGTSCLLPYPKYIKQGTIINTISLFRIHENGTDKLTEDLNYRIT